MTSYYRHGNVMFSKNGKKIDTFYDHFSKNSDTPHSCAKISFKYMIPYNFIFIIAKYLFGLRLWMGSNLKKTDINLYRKKLIKIREKISYFAPMVIKTASFIYY